MDFLFFILAQYPAAYHLTLSAMCFPPRCLHMTTVLSQIMFFCGLFCFCINFSYVGCSIANCAGRVIGVKGERALHTCFSLQLS